MDFRKANEGDIPLLARFRKQQLLDEKLPPVADIDRELLDYFTFSLADGSLISWLAIDGGEIIATSGICFYQLPPTYTNPTGRVAYVTNMYTLPSHRKQGIASRLLGLLLDEARTRGYTIVRLHASIDGKSIYRKFGFEDSEGYMAKKLS
ncbi:MAG: GNAT family N-acetyltransferase [Oscillospiraceae bacterium]|jgi:GNAT superfamily N-acetyltransferase|nr:GNAT family N-acetyltransferase [Oscillospiraceae bacterium]